MTRNDIIRMAQEAELEAAFIGLAALERFAALVAAAEREHEQRRAMAQSEQLRLELKTLSQRYEALLVSVARGVAAQPLRIWADAESYELGRIGGTFAEREACAKLLEETATEGSFDPEGLRTIKAAIAAIRARSLPKPQEPQS